MSDNTQHPPLPNERFIARESVSLSTLLADPTVQAGVLAQSEALFKYDYRQLNADNLHKLYNADETSGIQFGSCIFRPIVQLPSAVECGLGFNIIVLKDDNNPEEDLTQFINNY